MFLLMGIVYNLLALMFLLLFTIVVTFFSTIINNYDLSAIMRLCVIYEKQKDKAIKSKTRLQIYLKFLKVVSIFVPYAYVFVACYTFLEMLYQWSKNKTFIEYLFKDYFELEENDFKDLKDL